MRREARDDRRKGGGAPLRESGSGAGFARASEGGRQGGVRPRRATTVGRGAQPPSESAEPPSENQVRALRKRAVPMPAKMMLAVQAARAAGSRSAWANAIATECTIQ